MRVAIIGYGEVGRILAEDLRRGDRAVAAADVAWGAPSRDHAVGHGVRLASDHADAVRGAALVVSAVTASETLAAAEACAAEPLDDAFFVDMNSASPATKRRAAAAIEAAGGRYVEGAVMASVPPHRIRLPLLLGGPHAAAALPVLEELGFVPRVASAELGVASATKMCRSVLVKGLEAMVVESLVAARHHGVEDAVLASMRETFPGIDWERQVAYFFQRTIEHGRRRAEEMREVATTVREAGLEPWSAAGSAERQAWMAGLAAAGVFGERSAAGFARNADWRVEADRILASLR